MKHSCKLMFYKFFTVEETYAAIEMLSWFEEESMSGKVKFDSKKNEWIKDPNLQLPSWKHLTRGGHHNGMNIQRGSPGVYLRVPKNNVGARKDLIFRRHGDKRTFVVQRMEDLKVSLDLKFRMDRRECICKRCIGDAKVKSKLNLEDFQLYKEL